jgi:hypothetical protein
MEQNAPELRRKEKRRAGSSLLLCRRMATARCQLATRLLPVGRIVKSVVRACLRRRKWDGNERPAQAAGIIVTVAVASN